MKSSPRSPSSLIPQDYHRRLCEHLGVALIGADRELNIVFWNAAATRTFGAGADRMIGAPVDSIFPRERRNTAKQTLERTMQSGEPADLEFQSRDAGGALKELILTAAPVVSEEGKRIGVSACVRDITRRIALQAELNEARKMNALGNLAGTIAHHFNNILGGVITSMDYAQTADDPAVTRRVLAQASRSLQRATSLVNGLLAFSRGDPGAHALADFTEVINNLAELVERQAKEAGVQAVINIPRLPVIPVPRGQVTTIFQHIVQNAFEAMAPANPFRHPLEQRTPVRGQPQIEGLPVQANPKVIRIDVTLQPGHVVTSLEDTGCGLDEEARSRIFEPFWSTKRGPDRSGVAAGLGLAIVHGLVLALGGSIDVESTPGKGSRFTVSLPIPRA